MVMIKLTNKEGYFRCKCGCNVFHISSAVEFSAGYTIFVCNVCGNEYCESEGNTTND